MRMWHLHLLALTLCAATAAQSDSWLAPNTKRWSPDGKYLLRVDGWLSKPIKLTLKRKNPNGLEKLWSVASPQSAPPVEVHFSPDAKYVVLQDEWHEVGSRIVLAFIGPKGRVLRTYRLAELLPESEILDCPRSISSTWWMDGGRMLFRRNGEQFVMVTHQGTLRCFDLATGGRVPLTDELRSQIREEAIAGARAYLTSKDSRVRGDCASVLGALKDTASIDAFKKLLQNDPDWGMITVYEPPDKEYKTYSVRLTAGEALVSILGDDAAPLIGAALTAADKDGQYVLDWAEVLDTCHGLKTVEVWRKLLNNRDEFVRRFAISAISEADGGETVREHPEWLKDRSNEVRWAAVRGLAESPKLDDEKNLVGSLNDPYEPTRFWAARGLIKLNPPDLDVLLRRMLRHADSSVRAQARLELARRSDPTQLADLLEWIGSLGTKAHPSRSSDFGPVDLEDVCVMLAETKPGGAIEALQSAARSTHESERISAVGALAVLGDRTALQRTRNAARLSNSAFERSESIRWLGRKKDVQSLPLLRSAAVDEDSMVREAAEEALKELQSGPISAREVAET